MMQAPAQVPTCSGEVSLRSAAITESAVMRPVFGFSDGMFSIPIVNEAEFGFDPDLMTVARHRPDRPRFRSSCDRGRCPASDNAATTLTLAGNAAAASRAEPLKTQRADFNPSIEIPFSTR